MSISAYIKRHPVLSYYALTFAISWGAVLLTIWGFGGIPATKEQFATQRPVAILAMLGGPAVAGILLTGLTNGQAGLRELLSRLLRWRVGARWHAVALLTAEQKAKKAGHPAVPVLKGVDAQEVEQIRKQ